MSDEHGYFHPSILPFPPKKIPYRSCKRGNEATTINTVVTGMYFIYVLQHVTYFPGVSISLKCAAIPFRIKNSLSKPCQLHELKLTLRKSHIIAQAEVLQMSIIYEQRKFLQNVKLRAVTRTRSFRLLATYSSTF